MAGRTPSIAFAFTITVASAVAGCAHPHAPAGHLRPAPGTAPTMDEAAVARPDSFCPYVSDDGPALVCIDISSMGRIGAVLFDVGAGTRRAIPLIDVEGFDPCGGSDGVRSVHPEGFAALDRELATRIYRPTAPVLAYDPTLQGDSEVSPPTPPPYTAGAATITFTDTDGDRALTLTRGEQVLEALATHWYPVAVIPVGAHHVGVVNHHRIQLWDLTAPAPACTGPRCPPHAPLTRRYLGAICDDAFADQNESYPMSIAEDQSAGALVPADFAILAAAYRALTGDAFADRGLRELFYGVGARAWLPAACFGRFASLRALPEGRRWERDLIERGARGEPVE